MRKLIIGLTTFLLSGISLQEPAYSGAIKVLNPTIDGYALDLCREWTVKCGQPAEYISQSLSINISRTWSYSCCQDRYKGYLKISQSGNRITGTARDTSNSTGGNINGTVQGNRVEFTRTWAGNEQVFVLTLNPNGQVLEGTFTGKQDTSVGTEFKATRTGVERNFPDKSPKAD